MIEKHKSNPSTVTVRAVGGIGNQLFCYFAGLHLSRVTDSRLIVDISDIRSGRSAHPVSIESLNLDAEYIETQGNFFQFYISRIFSKINRVILRGKFKGRRYHSASIGYDTNLEKLVPPVYLEGYFQTFMYFFGLKSTVGEISLKSPSEWYLNQEILLQKKPFTAIHVRRGDYIQHKETYGLLSRIYYEQSLTFLSQININLPVVVFSDEIESAKTLLKDLLPEDTCWVEPPLDSDAAESLLLMSKGNAIIIANSTFSWWAAAIGMEDNVVIAPRKWFRSMEDPLNLYPPTWNQIDSYWED